MARPAAEAAIESAMMVVEVMLLADRDSQVRLEYGGAATHHPSFATLTHAGVNARRDKRTSSKRLAHLLAQLL